MNFLFFLCLTWLTFAFECYGQVVQVTDANFDQLIKKADHWVVEFYADWCGYCTRFAPLFDMAEEMTRTTSYQPIYFGKVNIEENPALAARFFVSRLPALFHIHQQQVRALPMPRDVLLMVNSLKHQEWESISPIGGWRSPFSLFGRLLGWTGYSVNMLSTASPWLVLGMLSALLICGLGLTSYFARNSPNEEPSVSPAIAAGRSSSTAINTIPSATQRRQSKRID